MKEFIIKCPHCGAEYLIEELVMPEDVIGKRYAIKDSKGKIEYIEGELPEMITEYICDYCDKKFKVQLFLDAKTFIEDDVWESDYTVDVFKDRIELGE